MVYMFIKRAFCKTKIFVQNQTMREILPQAYDWYSEDKILSITPSLGEKIVLQMAQNFEILCKEVAKKTGDPRCLEEWFYQLPLSSWLSFS